MNDIIVIGLIVLVAIILTRSSHNQETWKWVDYRGHEYQIEVARHVH